MSTMTDAADLRLPTRHTYTVDDLAGMPEAGNRYELIDGVLVVTPAPVRRHQRGVAGLMRILTAVCPAELEVLPAPFDVLLSSDSLVQPDVLVAPLDDADRLVGPPLLAVEVLSPSTRLVDLNLKKARYEAAGCPSYWAVDPGSATSPAWLTAWELCDGAYVEVGRVEGHETIHLDRPFPVDITPAALVESRPR